MSLQKFEEQSRSKVKGYETDFDVEQGWGDLKNKLHQPQKRKKRFFFLPLLGLIGCLSTFAWFQSSTSNTSLNQISQIELSEENNISAVQTKKEDAGIANSIAAATKNDGTVINEITTIDQIAERVNLDSKAPIKPSAQAQKLTENSSKKNPQKIVAGQPLTQATVSENSSLVQKYTPRNLSPLLVLTEESTIENHTPIQNDIDKVEESNRSLIEIAGLLPASILPLNTTLNDQITDRLTLAPLAPRSIEVKKIVDPKRNSLSLLGGIYAFDNGFTFEGINEVNGTAFLQELEAFSFGLEGKFQVSKKVFLTAGIEYTQYNERFLMDESNQVSKVEELPVNIISNTSNGETEEIYGLVTLEGNEFIDVQHYNAYQRINLPIGLGVNIGSNKLNLDLSAGAIINLSSSKTGREWNNEVVISEDAMIYNQGVGFSIYAQTDFNFQIAEKLSLQVSPHLRKAMSNWSSRVGLSQKPMAYGLKIGLSRAF